MKIVVFVILLLNCFCAMASSSSGYSPFDLTQHFIGYLAIAIFVGAYLLVIFEEQLHLRKSKPVLLAAGLIWILIGVKYSIEGIPYQVETAIRHNFLEYTELFFFLLVAMTYINSMLERGVFDSLRNWLISRRLSFKALFWATGILAFLISPVADNLTTSLIMCAVILTVGRGQRKFVGIACTNVVVAANAGGAFSPFGDITTLMVWQKGVVNFSEFFHLFLPALINFAVPAFIMQFALPKGTPEGVKQAGKCMKKGGLFIVVLFLLTIITAVCFYNFINIPPVYGMMVGLSYLKFYGYLLKKSGQVTERNLDNTPGSRQTQSFDVFDKIAQSEWDTLFFFYGVILSVGGLAFLGYLSKLSSYVYGELGPTVANTILGLASAIVDNIPVMFAVLTMRPEMSHSQWLLITLTAGVGGSLLSIGSAAGVALMGQARGQYTFFTHLNWTPAIALGYVASICVHLWINGQ